MIIQNFILFFILTLLCFFIYVHYSSKKLDVTYVKSDIDGHEYLVRNLEDKQEASNILGTIRTRLDKICDYMKQKYNSDHERYEDVTRMCNRFNGDNIMESDENNEYTSYSVNKGEEIVFCIRARDGTDNLEDVNMLMFVALHELSHVMTISIGHTEEFWDNFRFILKDAMEIKIYEEIDFKNSPKSYCGTMITNSPLDNEN